MVNVYNGANGTIIDGSCRIYYPWNGDNIINDGSSCIIKAWLGEEYKGIGLPLAKGIRFGGTYGGSTNCDIELIGSGMEAGWVDWGGIGGHNRVVVRGYNPSGVAQVGTPPSLNDVDVYVHGQSLEVIRQEMFQTRNSVAKITATGTSQSTAASIDKSVRTVGVSGGASNAGLKLPNSAFVGNGHKIQVTDVTGTAKKVYPNTGGNILGIGLNNPATVPGLGTIHLTVVDADAGEWLLG
ncbi:endo-N-acetylneuraminidase domain protein [Aeromonas phage 4L372XY]|nr:endo-N-acetylneuraminidase domain protein [Aeromonas phage 4L372XY]QEG08800.1 endo-N-acetylneuraminidase domain protein [Aeromonas phage 4L372XY]